MKYFGARHIKIYTMNQTCHVHVAFNCCCFGLVSREICHRAEDVCISHAQYQKEKLLSQVLTCAPAKDCNASADIDQHPQCYNETVS